MIALPSRPRKGWIRRTLARHPRAAMAVRAGLAAVLAWFIARHLPDPAGDYPYYAPMGAVIATSTTLAGSLREAMQAVASIALGGAVATVADLLGNESNLYVLGVAVAVAVLVAGWRKLGSMGAWVPTAALFTLIIGGGEAYYVGIYAGLVLLGALIGLVITLLMPQLPLAPAQEALTNLRTILASQLEDLASGLDHDQPPDREQWEERHRSIQPYLTAARSTVDEVDQAIRGNRRAHYYREAIRTAREQFAALERTAQLVQETAAIIVENENAEAEQLGLGSDLRPAAARALQCLADVLKSVQGASADPDTLQAAHEATDELTRRMDDLRRPDRPGGGTLAASSIVMAVRRCLHSFHPARATDEEEHPAPDGEEADRSPDRGESAHAPTSGEEARAAPEGER